MELSEVSLTELSESVDSELVGGGSPDCEDSELDELDELLSGGKSLDDDELLLSLELDSENSLDKLESSLGISDIVVDPSTGKITNHEFFSSIDAAEFSQIVRGV